MRHALTKEFGAAFSVSIIPTLKDNFSYLLQDHATGELAAVDVNADIDPLIAFMKETNMLNSNSYRLATILTTHKHWDHAGGNEKLRDLMAGTYSNNGPITADQFRVVGGRNDNIQAVTQPVGEGDQFHVGELQVDVIDVPCHTKGHVIYKVHHPRHPTDGAALFTGDTMFIAGIGAFVEGSAQDMCSAMEKIHHLNDNAGAEEADKRTFVFPGHEYTAGFMKFSASVFPDKSSSDMDFINAQAAHYADLVGRGYPSVPSSLSDEKRQNTFLRVADPAFCSMMGKGNTVQLMDYLYNACD